MTDPAAPPDDSALRLNAALDDELDAAHRLDLEHALAADAALLADYRRLEATREAVRRAAPREAAPAALKARIAALGAPSQAPAADAARPKARADWLALAASFAAGIVVAGGALTLAPRGGSRDAVAEAVVADFARAGVSGQPIDVASSDRHTVKPWLASRVALGVAVADLAPEGFPLAGGRIAIVAAAPAPVLVYRRREHLIALAELPLQRGEGPSAPAAGVEGGFHLQRWRDAERAYVAVSDIDSGELADFVAAFRKAAAAAQGEGR